MANFCEKCGSQLNQKTGLCPNCDRPVQNSLSSEFEYGMDYIAYEEATDTRKKTTGKKSGGKMKTAVLAIVICVILSLAVFLGLVLLGVIDSPAVEGLLLKAGFNIQHEHEWSDGTCEEAPICEICGETGEKTAGHQWVAATCLDPEYCKECGKTGKKALGHIWISATCVAPKTCSACKATEGEPADHTWLSATCTDPEICSVCGETGGSANGHTWISATCDAPKTCSVCRATEGEAAGHRWVDATYTAPKTCSVCGATVGEKLQNRSVYINELAYDNKYGKVYYHDNKKANYTNNDDWRDLNTPGHIKRPVCDGAGKQFTYGIHMDGDQLGPYYITYNLDSQYTLFSGWCVMPDYKDGTADSKNYSKYFEIYCDGKLEFTSKTMKNGSKSQYFEIDVTDVDVLTIQYAPTEGPNDLAVLCDGLLS